MTHISKFVDYLDSPFGILGIYADQDGIMAIRFVQDRTAPRHKNLHTQQAIEQLTEYFHGTRKQFELSLNPQGTPFQKQVWRQLSSIQYGETCSYADIAKGINNPKAVRAVGTANGRNPLTIVVPCHRVIGSNGQLTGYAWGTDIKAGLLELEKNTFKHSLHK